MSGRPIGRRMGMGALRLTPWRKGPLLLLRRAGVFVALAAATFVAVLPAASAPMFLSSARNATLHRQLDAGCASNSGATIDLGIDLGRPRTGATPATELIDARRSAGTRLATPGLTAPVATLMGQFDLGVPGRAATDHVSLLGRDGFAAHVTAVRGPVGPGVWLPDRLATRLGVTAGDAIEISRPAAGTGLTLDGPGSTAAEKPELEVIGRMPVAAVYVDLRDQPDRSYWCGVRDTYRGKPGQNDSNLPVFDTVLVDPGVLAAMGAALDSMRLLHRIEWAIAAPESMTYEEGQRLYADLAAMRTRLSRDNAYPVSGSTDRMTSRPGQESVEPMNTRIGGPLRRAQFVHKGLLPPVVPITGAGVVVGLLVVAAAAVFWVQRRRRELAVLAAHGAGPAALGLKAVLEALPALVVGAVAGGVAGRLLVRVAGPDPLVSAGAPLYAALGAVATLLVAAAVVGVGAGIRSRSLTDQAPPRAGGHRLARLPWELLLVAAAVGAWWLLEGERQISDVAGIGVGSVAVVPARLLVVPILVTAGLTLFGCRLGVMRSRRRGATGGGTRVSHLLARRRITRHAVAAAVLAAATAIPVAFAMYGATVTGSVQSTVEAEARLQVGADLVATLAEPAPVPAALAGRGTAVTRLSRISVDGVLTEMLAVDPATFADGAFWTDGIDGPDLRDLTGRLGADRAVGMPIVPTGPVDVVWGSKPVTTLNVESTRLLPGSRGGYPVMLVDIAAIPPSSLELGDAEIWVRGDAAEAVKALTAAGVPLVRYTSAEERYANTVFEPVTFTFAYLVALSLLTGVVALVGLLLYLESRTPAHRRAYVILHRMGLRGPAHRRAVLGELTVPLGAGLLGGLVVAAGLVVAVGGEFDLDPAAEPNALISIPVVAIGATVAAVVAVALAATLFADARTRRADPSEVLRDSV